jgi:hypothetical protein
MVMEAVQDFEYMEIKDKKPQNEFSKPQNSIPQSNNNQDPIYLKIQLNYELIEEYLG